MIAESVEQTQKAKNSRLEQKLNALITSQNLVELARVLRRFGSKHEITNIWDDEGYSLLMKACSQTLNKGLGSLATVQVLMQSVPQIKHAFWINSPQRKTKGKNDRFTALHYAAFYGNLEALKYLLRLGGDPFVVNSHQLTLMHVAA